MLNDYFKSRINQSRYLPAFLNILADICRLRDSESLENLLARRAGGRLENVNLMEKLWEKLSHGSSKNILLATFFEMGLHPISKIADYSVLMHMIEPDCLSAISAKTAIDEAVVGDLYAITEETSISDLAAMARTLTGDAKMSWEKQGLVIDAALEKIGDNFGEAFNFSRNFIDKGVRNRFLICFIAKHGLKNRNEAEALALNIEPDQPFSDNLMGSILDAAGKAGFEYNPVKGARQRQLMSRIDELLLSVLPFILSGERNRIYDSRLRRKPQSPISPEDLPFGMECLDCPWRGTNACPLCFEIEEELAGFGGFSRGMGLHLMFPARGPMDFFQRLMHEKMGLEFPFQGESAINFPGFMEHLDLDLEPGFTPEEEISGILPGGLGMIWISKREAFLPEFPLEILTEALNEKEVEGVRPESITFGISTNVQMSIADILASNKTRDLIGPERVRILEEYVALFNRPRHTH